MRDRSWEKARERALVKGRTEKFPRETAEHDPVE